MVDESQLVLAIWKLEVGIGDLEAGSSTSRTTPSSLTRQRSALTSLPHFRQKAITPPRHRLRPVNSIKGPECLELVAVPRTPQGSEPRSGGAAGMPEKPPAPGTRSDCAFDGALQLAWTYGVRNPERLQKLVGQKVFWSGQVVRDETGEFDQRLVLLERYLAGRQRCVGFVRRFGDGYSGYWLDVPNGDVDEVYANILGFESIGLLL